MTPDGHPTYHLTQAALREPDLTITPYPWLTKLFFSLDIIYIEVLSSY